MAQLSVLKPKRINRKKSLFSSFKIQKKTNLSVSSNFDIFIWGKLLDPDEDTMIKQTIKVKHHMESFYIK